MDALDMDVVASLQCLSCCIFYRAYGEQNMRIGYEQSAVNCMRPFSHLQMQRSADTRPAAAGKCPVPGGRRGADWGVGLNQLDRGE